MVYLPLHCGRYTHSYPIVCNILSWLWWRHYCKIGLHYDLANYKHIPATRHRPDAGLMLVHRLKHWPNIKPTLVQPLVLLGHERKTFTICLPRTITDAYVPICFHFSSSAFRWFVLSLGWAGPRGSADWTLMPCCFNVGPASQTSRYHRVNIWYLQAEWLTPGRVGCDCT